MEITRAMIDAAFEAISDGAIGTGLDADGNLDGSDDWSHPTASAARKITEELGMSWDFTTWADAQRLALHSAVCECGHGQMEHGPGDYQDNDTGQIVSGVTCLHYSDDGRICLCFATDVEGKS